jgi:predicted MFS family arabinose efflux permease
LLAGTIPVVILTLIGGTLGDRWPRNRIMLASDVVRAAAQFVMAASLLRASPPLWALMATQLCYGAGAAFFDPAATGLLPEIVEPGDLPAANSALQFAANAALVAGPAVAGFVIALGGAPLAIVLDAASFLISGISLIFVNVQRGGVAVAADSLFRRLRAGFVELRRHRWVWVTAGYLVVLAFAFNGPMFVLGPATALTRLGGATAWSFMLSAFGVGLIAGSVLALRILRSMRALGWAYLGNLGVVPLLALLAASSSKPLIFAASILAGIAVGVFGVTYPTLLQQTIPAEMLSRVSSYFWLARVAAMPLALAIVAPLAARFGIAAVFAAAAIAIVVVTLASVAVPDVWRVGLRSETISTDQSIVRWRVRR